jgi:nucleoside-diphosphate-sugar epimerase
MSDSVIVFGATGFTGREVVAKLVKMGIPTVAHVRPDSARLTEWQNRFLKMGAKVDSTPWDEDMMTKTFASQRPSLVFCLLGTTRARIKQASSLGKDPKAQDYMAVDYGLTALLITAMQSAAVNARFVYLSAAGAGSTGTSPYGKARHLAEQAVLKSGIDYVICRPSFILGPGRDEKRTPEFIGAKMIDYLLFIPGILGLKKFRERYRSTTNVILAKSLVRIALDPASTNKIFESEQLRD